MHSRKRILKVITKKYKKDPDEVLILLWDINESRFSYLKNENSIIKQKDLNLVKDILDSKSEKVPVENAKKIIKKEQGKPVWKNYDFSAIGKSTNRILYITREEILKIYEELVFDFERFADPIHPSGLKNEHLLDSALFHPQTAYAGKVKYPNIESAGAAVMHAISNNHPFHNGNKRTAMVALLVFFG